MNLREYAKDRPCMLRIPGICNFNKETTVLCHIKRGWFASMKPPDICAVWGCSDCHDVIDGRRKTDLRREEIDSMILSALCKQLDEYVRLEVLHW